MDVKNKTYELSLGQSFEEVLAHVQPMITKILLNCRVYKNYDDYRHIASIAVWEAWQKADPSKGVFSSYIYTTIRGYILKELSKEHQYESIYMSMEDDVLHALMPSDEVTEDGRAEVIDTLFALLSQEEIELLQLLYVDGYSYQKIAQHLSISVEALKKRRTRLMSKIRG